MEVLLPMFGVATILQLKHGYTLWKEIQVQQKQDLSPQYIPQIQTYVAQINLLEILY